MKKKKIFQLLDDARASYWLYYQYNSSRVYANE